MTGGRDSGRGPVEALRELAGVGSRSAAAALARLLGTTAGARTPRLQDTALLAPRWPAGVLFEVHGDRSGLVALALTARGVDASARAFLGMPAREADADSLRAALAEVGNIVVSHTVSAMADALDARILPSLPVLVLDGEEPSLGARLERRRRAGARIRIDTELELDGELGALLVWLPDPHKPD